MKDEEKELLRDTYPSNSKTQRDRPEKVVKGTVTQTPREERVRKVIKGPIKKKKRGLFRRFTNLLLEDDTKSVGDYVVHDVLIPAAKNMVCDIIGWGGFAEILLFGEKRRSHARREGGRTFVNYGSFHRSSDRERDRPRDISRSGRSRHDFDEIVIETRGEAEEVLSHLVDLTIDYGMASVADFYDLLGVESNHTDRNWGWTDLHNASVSRVRDGYVINLPRTRPID
jgi:hypothetical protein